MTETELRNEVISTAESYKGISEGSTKHKEIINGFNNSGLCPRYKMTTSDPWCATFVSYIFIKLGLTSIFPCVECSCAEMISLAKKAGIWVEDDAYKPNKADVILYDWQDTTGSTSDNTGTPDHVGFVDSISGNSFVAIEGNKSDTVGTRNMTVNGKYIRGYITPDYAKAASGGTSSSGSGTTSSTGSGTTSSTSNKLDVDGEIGPKTVSRLQRFCGLDETGKIGSQPSSGKQYWTSILTSVVTWSSGKSDTVRAFQKYLADKGYYTGTKAGFKDGQLGKNTAKCAQQFLSDKGYYTGKIDSIFGEKSAMALQTWLNSY